MTTLTATSALRGGEWLLRSSVSGDVFTPEQRTDEHRLVGQTVGDFVGSEVLPVLARLEQKDWTLARSLVARCAAASCATGW